MSSGDDLRHILVNRHTRRHTYRQKPFETVFRVEQINENISLFGSNFVQSIVAQSVHDASMHPK